MLAHATYVARLGMQPQKAINSHPFWRIRATVATPIPFATFGLVTPPSQLVYGTSSKPVMSCPMLAIFKLFSTLLFRRATVALPYIMSNHHTSIKTTGIIVSWAAAAVQMTRRHLQKIFAVFSN